MIIYIKGFQYYQYKRCEISMQKVWNVINIKCGNAEEYIILVLLCLFHSNTFMFWL